jgi:nicotinate dehydrogenase subunit A
MALRSERVSFRVNGVEQTIEAEPGRSLGDVLRNALNLKGTRFGCGTEQCGACFVLVEGEPAFACTTEVATVAGKSITTVEGLGSAEAPHALQRAFLAEQAAQCGYCTSGMLVAAAALLARTPHPTQDEVRRGLDRNLCRCGSYPRIVRAVMRAAREAAS